MPRLTGKFVWFECVTSQVEKAKAFYAEVIGWKTQAFPMGKESYEMMIVGETPVGGYASPEDAAGAGAPSHWTSYVSVDDVDATAKKIVAEGGALLQAAFDVPEVGRMAKVADPQGASFWLMSGHDGNDAPDVPQVQGHFAWNELWARDGAGAVRFYTKVFGYTTSENAMPDGTTYNLLEKDGVPRAGIITSPLPNVPPMWLPYVAVDDCDTVAARTKKLGGAEHVPPTDVPDVGRFAILADPNGATFGILKPPPR